MRRRVAMVWRRGLFGRALGKEAILLKKEPKLVLAKAIVGAKAALNWKSFLVLFFKKELLACLFIQSAQARDCWRSRAISKSIGLCKKPLRQNEHGFR